MRREFTRVAWASTPARDVWEPRVNAVSNTWLDVELRSVSEGLRPAALVFGADRVQASRLPAIQVAPDRFAVGPTPGELAKAYTRGDDPRIGELLGFPSCCRAFFNRVWNAEGKRDTTLSMTVDHTTSSSFGCNILGRWLGVRFVPHLPCSFQCEDTAEFARALLPFWPEKERRWANEILSWPVKYSALHGAAVITFPVVKIVADTDYTASEQVLERHGSMYPDEAPSGLGFPFQKRRAVIQPRTNNNAWQDNGFHSRATMDEAHAMVLQAIGPRLVESVIDLGCGNGVLLSKIPARRRVGIESDVRKVGGDVRHGRIQDVEQLAPERFDLAVIAERRFAEMLPADAAAVRQWLGAHVHELLLYSYDEPRFAKVVDVSEA
jgi:hypothetical protein